MASCGYLTPRLVAEALAKGLELQKITRHGGLWLKPKWIPTRKTPCFVFFICFAGFSLFSSFLFPPKFMFIVFSHFFFSLFVSFSVLCFLFVWYFFFLF